MGQLNDRLALAIGVFVPLAAIPLASNRATWWLLWAFVLAGVALLALLQRAAVAPWHRPRFLRHRVGFGLALLVPAYALFQSLPIAAHLPEAALRLREGLDGVQPVAVSVLPGAGLIGVPRFLSYLILLALVLEVASRRGRMDRLATVLFAGVVLQSVWALVALRFLGDVAPWGKAAYLGSATGTFVNRNSLATYLGIGMVLGLGLLGHQTHVEAGQNRLASQALHRFRPRNLLIGVGLLIILLGLTATQSRLGMASTVAGVATTLALLRHQAGAGVGRIAAEVGAALLVLVLLVVLAARGQGLMQRALFLQHDSVNRLALYSQVLEMIRLRPVTGFGFDAFGPAFEAMRAPPLVDDVFYELAHNSYLSLWAELGLIVGSVPPILLGLTLVRLFRLRGGNDGFPAFASAAIGVIVLGAVHSMGDFSLEIPAVCYLFVAVVGIGLGVRIGAEHAGSGISKDIAAVPARGS